MTALTSKGQLFYLTDLYSSDELIKLREKQKFFCPVCRSDLILKIGQFKIPHFAHRASAECESFSEPESPLHLQGKLLLYQFFQNKNLPVELEKFLPSIKQRADVLVDGRLAVEYQCSVISPSIIEGRTSGYRKLGIETIWIHQGKPVLPPGIQPLKIKPFEKAFSSDSTSKSFLLGMNPDNENFVYYSNLFYMGGNQWIGKVSYLPLSKQVHPFAVPKRLKKEEFDLVFALFTSGRNKFIKQQLFARNPFTNPYWRSCYELSINAYKLPFIIGIPMPDSEHIPVHPVLWQLKAVEAISQNRSAKFLLDSGQLPLRNDFSEERALVLLETYMHIYRTDKSCCLNPNHLKKLLYDYYCNVM